MINQPLVSIIIPTYNRAELIGETLDSVLAQTYQNWECIVVDDGSSDNTDEVLKNYINKDSRIQYYHRPKQYKPGGNGARNFGFDISKGEYINWFDSDDIMHHLKLEIQVNLLKYTIKDFTVCNTYIFENNIKNIIGIRSSQIHSNEILFDYLTQKNAFLTNAILWRKSFLKDKYFYNENLRAAQEWEFNSIVMSDVEDYSYTVDCLVYNRRHECSISYSKKDKEIRELNYLIARKFVYKYIENRINYVKEKEFLLGYIKLHTEKLIKQREYKLLNKVIFYNGYNFQNFISYLSIYFFIYTNRLKSKVKYV